MNRDQLTTVLALLVGLVWAVTTISSIVTHEYVPLEVIQPVMLIVAGFLFAKAKNGDR